MYEGPGNFSGPWNFGPDKSSIITVAELADLIVNIWGKGSWKSLKKPNQPHETTLLRLDSSKAKNLLGWVPQWNIETSLEKTISWYKQQFDNPIPSNAIINLATDQIRDYNQL